MDRAVNVATIGTEKNDPRVARLAAAVFERGSLPAGAEHAGISRRTAYRLAKTPAYRECMGTLQAEALSSACSGLAAGTGEAVAVLRALAREAEHESTRCRAAVALLDSALRWRSALDLEQRLATLEALHHGHT